MQNDKKEGVKPKRTLYVFKTSYQQLWYLWDEKPIFFRENDDLFIQCNKSGQVNWEKNSVYKLEELENRPHKIVNR